MEGEMDMKGMIFIKTMLSGNYEYQMDFDVLNDLEKEGSGNPNFNGEATWSGGFFSVYGTT
mgnify:CR=1 FL=1